MPARPLPDKVIIIGAGVSGLSVGCYLQMNGFRTEIVEMHTLPGGVCTAWTRKGYTFDGCIHWLMGSSPGPDMHRMWRELHAVQGKRFVEWDQYATVRTPGGQQLTVYTDPSRLRTEMLRLGPEDGRQIDLLCRAIERFSRIDMPVTTERMGPWEKMRIYLPYLAAGPTLARLSSTSVQQYCARLHSRALAGALAMLAGGDGSMPDFPLMGLAMMLGFMHRGSNGYPIGGSKEFARSIEKRYLELGGSVRYGAKVEKILVENGAAVGIVVDGVTHGAAEVISCADGHATIFDMLGGRYMSPLQREAYESYPVFASLLYVGIGLARDMTGLPSTLLFSLPGKLRLEDGGLEISRMGVRFFSFDPTMAPAGKTAATVMIESRNLPYWEELRRTDTARYREEKRRVGELVVDALERELGGIRDAVEVVDVATPATWHRYTGNWQGSYEGFLPTRKTMMKNLGFTLPGLAHFWMHGQWVAPGGGLPPAGMNGRALAKLICRSYGRRFTASE
jgi:phytoene dehydrogenase-like protein